MLSVLEGAADRKSAQAMMRTTMTERLDRIGVRRIGFPSGSRDEPMWTAGPGRLWCAFGSAEDATVPRRWNAFGVYDAGRPAQLITVEINIPTKAYSERVAGFFARDTETGRTYLLHDGGVGGGRKGVGQLAFLAWSGAATVETVRENGRIRRGIVIGDVSAADLTDRVWRFVRLVRSFKDAVAAGELGSDEFLRRLGEYERYTREFSGRKVGRRNGAFDYVTRHGDVVHALRRERRSERASGERILNSVLVDLYVRLGERLTEVDEVKMSLDRQLLYGALGQLMTHSLEGGAQVRRVLVVPEGRIAPDIDAALAANRVELIRFRLGGGRRAAVSFAPAAGGDRAGTTGSGRRGSA